MIGESLAGVAEGFFAALVACDCLRGGAWELDGASGSTLRSGVGRVCHAERYTPRRRRAATYSVRTALQASQIGP